MPAAAPAPGADYALEVTDLVVNYGVITALGGVSLRVRRGSIATLIGGNGAGKSTTLRAISGLRRPRAGTIRYDGQDLAGLAPHEIVRRGLAQVPEGRMVFTNLTVQENLQMGAYLRPRDARLLGDLDFIFSIFPRLKERLKQEAGTLSGGEQQMLAISRALMSQPRFLMLDEPSLGVAPILCKTIFEQIVAINRTQGITVLLVEQNAHMALEIAEYAYVCETGRVIAHGPAEQLRDDPQVKSAYLGG